MAVSTVDNLMKNISALDKITRIEEQFKSSFATIKSSVLSGVTELSKSTSSITGFNKILNSTTTPVIEFKNTLCNALDLNGVPNNITKNFANININPAIENIKKQYQNLKKDFKKDPISSAFKIGEMVSQFDVFKEPVSKLKYSLNELKKVDILPKNFDKMFNSKNISKTLKSVKTKAINLKNDIKNNPIAMTMKIGKKTLNPAALKKSLKAYNKILELDIVPKGLKDFMKNLGIDEKLQKFIGTYQELSGVLTGVKQAYDITKQGLRDAWAWCLKNSSATKSMTLTQKIGAVANSLYTKSVEGINKASKFLRFNFLKEKAIMIASNTWKILCATGSGLLSTSMNGISKASKILRLGLLKEKAIMVATNTWKVICAAGNWLLTTSLGAATIGVWAFTAALLANPITWVVVGIVALIAGIVALVYWFKDIVKWVMGLSDWILYLLGPIGMVILIFKHWGKIGTWLKNIFAPIWDIFLVGCKAVWNFLSSLFMPIFNVLGSFFSWLGELLAPLWDGFLAACKKVWNFLSSLFMPIFNNLGTFFEWLGGLLAPLWDGFLAACQNVWSFLSSSLIPVIQFLSDTFGWLGELFSSIWDGIVSC